MKHIPVMAAEIISIFADAPKGVFIDATYGLGGHTREILKAYPNKFKVIGFEKDQDIFKMALENKPDDVTLMNMSFSRIEEIIESDSPGPVTGALFDLGLNSAHIDDPERGFSYLNPGPLDLRFDKNSGNPASDAITKLNEKDIQKILSDYGQERRSRQIAREIFSEKPKTTQSLADLIRKVAGPKGFIKSASRVFQALRIYVNDELNEINIALNGLIPRLASGGRVAVISYHSLEDGLIKRNFRRLAGKCYCEPNVVSCECGAAKYLNVITRKPIRPSDKEVKKNSRSRPARLRYAERI
jgi:16S rRNA (cytosine1402-N4)-methyltransferase